MHFRSEIIATEFHQWVEKDLVCMTEYIPDVSLSYKRNPLIMIVADDSIFSKIFNPLNASVALI